MSGSPLVGGSKYMSWHPASIERMLKTDACILRVLDKMLFSLPGLPCRAVVMIDCFTLLAATFHLILCDRLQDSDG